MQKKTCLQKRLQGVESKICVQKRKVDLWLWLWPRESPVTAGFKLQNRFFVTKREYWHLPKYPQFCSWRLTLHGNRLNCTKIIHFFSRFTFCPLLPTHCRWRGLLLHLSTLHDTHTHTHTRYDSSGWVIGPSQWPLPTQHTTFTKHLSPSEELESAILKREWPN